MLICVACFRNNLEESQRVNWVCIILLQQVKKGGQSVCVWQINPDQTVRWSDPGGGYYWAVDALEKRGINVNVIQALENNFSSSCDRVIISVEQQQSCFIDNHTVSDAGGGKHLLQFIRKPLIVSEDVEVSVFPVLGLQDRTANDDVTHDRWWVSLFLLSLRAPTELTLETGFCPHVLCWL